ncbi:serine/threonine-protein kinase PLK1 [Neolamprologus brichardi]|uniref:serine/threonine-protein kinase PLK1 n=1 Tax=Neolamprologus brichardi TaxID=32507 RepID=UPI0016436B34|nr:serine/threonine-protein kinase PLK1 [Neolamprologus brichardi]
MSAGVAKPANPMPHVDPKSATLKEIPDVLVDPRTMRRYTRGRFLGKGGFAKCYEITDVETKQVFAGKIVPKSLILKQHQREKMTSEISIHQSLNHPNVVGFHGFFEDDDFVFVVLEICRRRSLLELHKRRKAVTEPEARYYMTQLLKGVQYLHNNKVIHRDLKLGNIFLNDDMDVKIGDFGLATKIEFDGERKKTLCGTPNYIAPEVLCKKGHSYEVDYFKQEFLIFISGYQLCDNSVGVLFNDYTRLIMYADGDSLQYIDKTATESYMSVRSFPSTLNKKITLLKYFRNYMSEHLLKAGANIARREGDELARLPYLSLWFRTKSAIVLHLTNGTVQINFFQDHTKLILCPLMAAVTYIDEKRDFRTYKLSLLEEFGCSKELASRIRYAKLMVEKLLDSKPTPAAH